MYPFSHSSNPNDWIRPLTRNEYNGLNLRGKHQAMQCSIEMLLTMFWVFPQSSMIFLGDRIDLSSVTNCSFHQLHYVNYTALNTEFNMEYCVYLMNIYVPLFAQKPTNLDAFNRDYPSSIAVPIF